MKINVTCAGCGKEYAVGPADAGRRGRCSRCGREFTVPSRAAPTEPEGEGYALSDLDGGSAYVAAPGSEIAGDDDVPENPRVRKAKKTRSAAALGAFDVHLPKAPKPGQYEKWRKPLIGLGATLLSVVVLALIFPRMAALAGALLTVTGFALLALGYAAGAYTAFTEDFVHGFFYLIVPIYAAYYFVSRFEDMKLQLAAVLIGLALLAAGGQALVYSHWASGAADVEASVEVIDPEDAPPPAVAPRPRAAKPAR